MATPLCLSRRLVYRCLALLVALSGRALVTSSQKEDLSPENTNHKQLSILIVTGYFPGHLYPITALGEELVKRGHNVTLCATVMEGSDLLPALPHSYGINFISAGPDNLTQAGYEKMVRSFQNFSISQMSEFVSLSHWPVIKIRSKVDEIGVDQFDFIISDFSVSPVGVYYAKLGKKVMIVSPLFVHFDATIPDWPSPAISTSLSDNLTFLSRAGNALAHILLRLFQYHVFGGVVHLDKAFERVLKDTSVYEYIGIRTPFVMASTFGFEYAKTRYPLTEYVGPLMMSSFPPLEDKLVEWLDNKPNRSVIYFGMGATGFITTPIAQVIISGILATDFSAVWALPMSDQAVLEGVDIDKDRFFISKWIPRQTLFKHPKLVMTILHCAMNSVQESLYNGLPMVCVPHSFDHFDVAARVAGAQVGIPLYSITDSLIHGRVFTSENLTNLIKTVTGNKKYGEQANKFRKIFRFAGGAMRASDLVEFYAEVGYDHLIPAYAKYEWSWVHYYNLDVYSLLSLLSFLLITLPTDLSSAAAAAAAAANVVLQIDYDLLTSIIIMCICQLVEGSLG